MTIEEIQKKVAEYFKIRLADMTSARRARQVARPRQVAMYLAKQITQRSLPEIGRRFGNRDHTTVMHALLAGERTDRPRRRPGRGCRAAAAHAGVLSEPGTAPSRSPLHAAAFPARRALLQCRARIRAHRLEGAPATRPFEDGCHEAEG